MRAAFLIVNRFALWSEQGPEFRPVNDNAAFAIGAQLAHNHLNLCANLNRAVYIGQLGGDDWPFVQLDQGQYVRRERFKVLRRSGDCCKAVDRSLAGQRD
jgi:hypothetical protein